MVTVELETLIGPHLLTGVDLYNQDVQRDYGAGFDDCQHISFCLDGVTYTAIENPADGYRSLLGSMSVSDHVLQNTFPPVAVDAVCAEKGTFGMCEILHFINHDNGLVVLCVGTGNWDDYYPYFVAEFIPENIGMVPSA